MLGNCHGNHVGDTGRCRAHTSASMPDRATTKALWGRRGCAPRIWLRSWLRIWFESIIYSRQRALSSVSTTRASQSRQGTLLGAPEVRKGGLAVAPLPILSRASRMLPRRRPSLFLDCSRTKRSSSGQRKYLQGSRHSMCRTVPKVRGPRRAARAPLVHAEGAGSHHAR